MNTSMPTILVIFGISGDLAKRKLLPAIGHMAEQGILPEEFRIVGITRRSDLLLDDLLQQTENKDYIVDHCELFEMDHVLLSEFQRLSQHIKDIESNFSKPAQVIFYISVPPQISYAIIELLGTSGLSKASSAKILFEKPSGFDLKSATELIHHINKYFDFDQVYRVDHYLAKETAQSIIPFRENNSLIEETLNKDFVDHIEITASEMLDIEGRAGFYEQTGALRDMVQSHLLEALTLIIMNVDMSEIQATPERRLAVLKCLSVAFDAPIVRGQYEGYREEVAKPESNVETFVSLVLQSTDPRWIGVPIKMTTGKALKEKYTEIKVSYKDSSKESLRFIFKDQLAEAHEYVLENAINSNHNLFVSSDEALETWRIVDQVQEHWKQIKNDLIFYKKGTKVDDMV